MDAPGPCPSLSARPDPAQWKLPRAVEAALWRADHLSRPTHRSCPTGYAGLDSELPGGGWPTHGLTEVLQQPNQAGQPLAEWRLLLPGLRQLVRQVQPLVLIGPPWPPHAPGLHQAGLNTAGLVWVQARTTQERLWATEQMIKGPGSAGGLGSLITWLPQAQPAQIRRLQTWALHCDAPVFVVRPAHARQDASAAVLRVMVALADASTLQVSLLKRRGPVHEGLIELNAWPAGLQGWAEHRQTMARRPAMARSTPRPATFTQDSDHALAVSDSLSR